MKIFNYEYPDLPGIGEPEWETAQISVSLSSEQAESIKSAGIDLNEQIRQVMTNEIYQNIAKLITTGIFKNKEEEKVNWDKKGYWLADILDKTKPLFIVANIQLGVGLQDSRFFKSIEIKNTLAGQGISMYMIGKFDGIPLYIDPMMRYDDNKIGIAENNFVEYEIDKNSGDLTKEIFPRITFSFKYKLHYSKSSVYKLENINF